MDCYEEIKDPEFSVKMVHGGQIRNGDRILHWLNDRFVFSTVKNASLYKSSQVYWVNKIYIYPEIPYLD